MPPDYIQIQPVSYKKRLAAAIIAIAMIGIGAYVLVSSREAPPAAPVEEPKIVGPVHEVIGTSVEGRDIDAYTYGTGPKHLLFVGGVHGGYEWNSVLLAHTFMDYLVANPEAVPENLSVTVIPSANPDAVFDVVGKEGRFTASDASTVTKTLEEARFNANGVDLNRNFDCKWQPKSTWRTKTVSAGKEAFSEPEAKAIRDFISKHEPDAAVFWHSQSNAVYASQCENGILPGTIEIMDAYSKASGYPAVKTFDAYVTTGAADDWLASVGVPAITVELKTHEAIEWERNLAGIKALFSLYGQQGVR